MVKFLVGAGSDLGDSDKDGNTALHYAVLRLQAVVKEQNKEGAADDCVSSFFHVRMSWHQFQAVDIVI